MMISMLKCLSPARDVVVDGWNRKLRLIWENGLTRLTLFAIIATRSHILISLRARLRCVIGEKVKFFVFLSFWAHSDTTRFMCLCQLRSLSNLRQKQMISRNSWNSILLSIQHSKLNKHCTSMSSMMFAVENPRCVNSLHWALVMKQVNPNDFTSYCFPF